jgi:Cu(I)/Ag(I) efflux system membrane protein CusA/SilA
MRKLFKKNAKKNYVEIPYEERIKIIEESSIQVSRGVFFSTVIIITSFLPLFLLTGQEGKLFHPLAFTKTFILIVDAVLVITLAPALISIFMKGRFKPESHHFVNRWLEKIYAPIIQLCIKWRKTTLFVNIAALLISIPLLVSMGREFMPPLDEGNILFMPVTLPDVSNSEIKRILQVQDKIITTVPEVKNVLGKAGRVNSATDNSPINMIETIILLKPQKEWRKGITKNDIINELNRKLQIPGVTNGWTQPIINRINMLSTGIRTDVGIKVYGQNLDTIYALSEKIKQSLKGINGIEDLYVEPITGGRYIDINIKRNEITPSLGIPMTIFADIQTIDITIDGADDRYGLSIDDVNDVIETALGGKTITTTIEGRERFTVNARFAQDFRSSLFELQNLQVQTPENGSIPLKAVADIQIAEGPPMINSENALLRGTVLFNVRNRDLSGTVQSAMEHLNNLLKQLPKG